MFRKFLLALVALPFFSLAVADEDGPNPGDDNPGSKTIELSFYIAGEVESESSCFDSSEFCTSYFVDGSALTDGKGKGKHAYEAYAQAAASVACAAAASAESYARSYFQGAGVLTLTRHGNHGAMHHIKFNAGLEAGSMSFAAAGAAASAQAHTDAYVFANASAWEDVCLEVDILDIELAEFCAWSEAWAASEAGADAFAYSFAGSDAIAESRAGGFIGTYNEVWAANIEEYRAVVSASAGSFAASDASAFASAYAEAYAFAYAEAYAAACTSVEILDIYEEFCSDGAAAAEAYAWAYAEAYAEARAAALGTTEVSVYVPALYRNENGIEDTYVLGPPDVGGYLGAATEVSCVVPEGPDDD